MEPASMNTAIETRRVDNSVIRINMIFTIGLLLLAFILDAPWLAAIVAVVNFVAALHPPFGLWRATYNLILKPLGLVKPDPVIDNPEPHRFSQGLGSIFVGIGVLALYAGANALGWAFVWLVIGLAAINLFLHFCVGCFMYYQLNRLGVPGFRYRPVQRGS
jgi:hypothetical protein